MELDDDNIRIYSKCIHEILLQKNSEILNQIKSLKVSAIAENSWPNISQLIMNEVNEKLIEWDINIPSFHNITSSENSFQSFRYLLESIQNDNTLNTDLILELNNRLKKNPKNIEIAFDCCEKIPELLEELKTFIEQYNSNSNVRITFYKSLKDFATNLFGLLTQLARQLPTLPDYKTEELKKTVHKSIEQLFQMSFVISDYPPKLIKKRTTNQTGTHFNATISFLIEKDFFLSNPQIQIYFLSEENLKYYIKTQTFPNECKIVCNDLKRPSINNWTLPNMIWDPHKQSKDKKKSERKTNIKSIILFKVRITANPFSFFPKPFEINTDLYSDTVISVVHTNQEVNAYLTLFWDEYFRADKQPVYKSGSFDCHDSVNIKELINAISDYFLKQTTRGLTASNRLFLEQKLFTMVQNGLVNFHFFSKISMLESDLSFGQWIFQIIKLLKLEGIIGMWKNDLIDGFVHKDLEGLFLNCPKGTFSLRFSEKKPKIGVIVWVSNQCSAWSPFCIEECRSRSLPDRLLDYDELRFIRNALGKYVSKQDSLSIFIDDKTPDIGYTQRGRLSKLLDGNIYKDSLEEFESDSPFINLMDTDDFSLFNDLD